MNFPWLTKNHLKDIDRFDNDQGYTNANSKPCCKICNYMKSDYTIDFFLKQCQKIAKNVKHVIQVINDNK